MNVPHPLLGMALVLAALGGLLGALTAYRRAARPHPEVVRKLLHVGMGMVTASFPWLFDSAWPVASLAILAVSMLLCLRVVARFRNGIGQVVCGVQRSSLGEIYFPLGITLLWGFYLWGAQEPQELRLLGYIIPVLLLTLSDALAALVGVSYGQLRYDTPDGSKSHEGSLAFFLCSFLCVHIPLLLMTSLGRHEVLLISVLLALMMTLFEAIAWSGLDNLVLPPLAHVLLLLYWDLTAAELVMRLAVMGLLSLGVYALSWLTPMRGSAVAGAALVGYVCWALGDWRWLLPPLMLYLGYVWLSHRNPVDPSCPHTVHAVAASASVGLAWLFLSLSFRRPDWLFPFAVAFAVNLAIVALAQVRHDRPAQPLVLALVLCASGAWLAVLAPYAMTCLGSGRACREALVALPAVAGATGLFLALQPRLECCPVDGPRWLRQCACAAAASGAAALALPLLG
jgi:phytol kinase